MPQAVKQSQIVFICLLLTLSTLLVYWQVRTYGFVYDDSDYVAKNVHVLNGLTGHGFIWAFTTGHSSNWHPLTWLSHMLDCQMFGPNPGAMHLTNIFLHLANAILLFEVFRRMTSAVWPSAFVAAAFAIHPMHVESVAWIAERKDVLSTLFMLLTLAAYISYCRRGSTVRYLMTILLFAAGLMAKPMLVTLPFMLLLLDYWPLGRLSWSKAGSEGVHYLPILEKVPFLILALASSVATFLVQQSGGSVIGTDKLPMGERAANAVISYMRYIGNALWPHDLAAFYPFDPDGLTPWKIAVSVVLMLVISMCVVRFGRNQRYLPVGWFWFVGTLVPVMGFVQVGGQAFADRYTYIPYIGLFMIMAWGLPELLSKWPYRRLILGISAVSVLAALGACARSQVGYWRDGITLFSRAIEVTRNNDIAYNNRGAAYYDLGRWQKAIEDCKEAVRINSDYAAAYKNLGFAYGKLGQWQEAIENFRQVIRVRPDYAVAYNNLGFACGRLGLWLEATEAFERATRMDPDYSEAYYNLGVTYHSLGRYPDAIGAYKKAIKADPWYAEAYNDLGNAYGRVDDWQEAIDAYRQAIRLKPDYAEAHNNIAWLIATNAGIRNRNSDEAIRSASRACELLNWRDPVSMGTLAAAYASSGRFGEAVDMARRAMNLADAANQPQVTRIIQYHLSFYTRGEPYIEPVRESPVDPRSWPINP